MIITPKGGEKSAKPVYNEYNIRTAVRQGGNAERDARQLLSVRRKRGVHRGTVRNLAGEPGAGRARMARVLRKAAAAGCDARRAAHAHPRGVREARTRASSAAGRPACRGRRDRGPRAASGEGAGARP